ncbi:hypothetical protein EKO27_g7866 [Xylaria grammica]|uniref:Major facilitator superfamily (MFS) profile domain-containing protein n=1 Tax=Xylaria grammica TaxID=363999 RepID=A0A439CYF3_9PEZI|nr:hypothetical protein EKO27_g7866 [Xylaria grammica]
MTRDRDTGLDDRGSTEEDKAKVIFCENVSNAAPLDSNGLTEDEVGFLENFSDARRKALLRKIGFRLVPMLGLLYLQSNTDRTNIGNAKIEGLPETLCLSTLQYNTCLGIFFVPCTLLEIPSNLALKRFARLSYYIGALTISWSVVLTLTGIVRNYQGLLVARLFLGIAEAGFFPGAILIISTWYDRHELATRIAIFYLAAALAGAFSCLLAYLIVKLDGLGGLEGWRWIFIIEGLATLLLGCATPWLLLDSPERTTILSEDEKRYLRLRKIIQDGGRGVQEKGQKLTWAIIKTIPLDWKLYLAVVIYWTNNATNDAIKFTLPRILKNMGYTSANSQLLSIPPYIAGTISAYIACRYSDRLSCRMPFILGAQLFVTTGFALLVRFGGHLDRIAESYVAVFIACLGFYPITPNVAAWVSNNLAGSAKRAAGIAFMLMLSNTAGLVGSYIYKDEEKPTYPTGYGVSLALSLVGIIGTLLMELLLWRVNVRDSKMTEEEIRAKWSDQELADMGDKSPLLKYTL